MGNILFTDNTAKKLLEVCASPATIFPITGKKEFAKKLVEAYHESNIFIKNFIINFVDLPVEVPAETNNGGFVII